MKTKYSHLFIALVTFLSAMTIHSCGENEIIVPNKTEEDTKLEIDSVSSHFKFEYTYNDDVIELTDEQISYVDLTRGEYFRPSSIYLKSNTPKELIPKKGTILVVFTENEVYPLGLMSVVNSVTQLSDGILLDVSDATLEEVYKELDMDIRLNAEQIKQLKYASSSIGEPELEEINESDFFMDAPACQEYFRNINNGNYAFTNICSSTPSSSENKTDDNPKKWYELLELHLSKADDGFKMDFKYPLKEYSDKKEKFKCTFGYDGYIKYRPLSIESAVKISNGIVKEQDLGTAINIEWDADFYVEGETDKFGKIPLNAFIKPIPIPNSPVLFYLLCKPSIGVKGKVRCAFTAKNNFTICIPKETKKQLETNTGLKNKVSTDFNFMKLLFNKIKLFEFDGSAYFEAKGGLAIGFPALPKVPKNGGGIGLNTKIEMAGKFDVLDLDNFKNNPNVSLDATVSTPLFYAFDLDKFDETNYTIEIFKYTKNIGSFPIFPQLDDICGFRQKGSPTAEITYSTDPWYLLAPLVAAKGAKLNMCFASSKWKDDPVDGYIVKTETPEEVYKDGLNVTYKASIDNLSKNESYCGIPRFEMLGIKYYGTPIELENKAKRLALIGPAFGANFEYEQPSLALGYDSEGHVKKVIDKFMQMESYITRNPLVITQHEYEFDYETGQKVYDSPLYITNIVLDKKSGVITSCHWYDGIGNMKFYYDDQYHLTGMAGGGIFIKLDWDSNGDLKTITSSEDGFTDVIVQYEYSDKINPQGTWTLATGYIFDVLSYGKFIGRAPTHLPKHFTLTSIDSEGTNVESYDISYETKGSAGVGEISNEIVKFKSHGQKYEISFPYVYRNVSISDQQLEYDENLGITRSAENDGNPDKGVIEVFRRLRKARLFSR